MRLYKIIVGLTAVMAALAIIPWVDGFLFKRNYYHWIKMLASDKTVDLQILDYHQGWFHSTARLSISAENRNFVLDQTICHGPLVQTVDGQHWMVAVAAILNRFNVSIDRDLEGTINSRAIITTTYIQQQTVWNTPYGNAVLNGEMVWPVMVNTVKSMIRGAKGQANLRMPNSLVDRLMRLTVNHQVIAPANQMQEEWNRLVKRGIIQQDKTDYVISLTLEKGIVKAANGRHVLRLM